jgi:hypothetical protein
VVREAHRGIYERAAAYEVLDEGFICHVGFVVDGQPFVIPTGYGRTGDNLYIHGSAASRMLRNLDASFGLVFSQPVLLALVECGRTRDDAYRIVQRSAMRAWQEERPFRELLREDPDVTSALDDAHLDACFDLKRALANVGQVFAALDRLEGADA